MCICRMLGGDSFSQKSTHFIPISSSKIDAGLPQEENRCIMVLYRVAYSEPLNLSRIWEQTVKLGNKSFNLSIALCVMLMCG